MALGLESPVVSDVMQAESPPEVNFFRNLPSHDCRCWGVYALTLEKPGMIPQIYIGTGTGARYGVHSRFTAYDRIDASVIAENVLKAIRDGYKITHKGLLAWSPLPSAANVPKAHVLFLAMETSSSLSFWTMRSRKPDYRLLPHCLWPLSSFTYAGLCSHSPLIEGV